MAAVHPCLAVQSHLEICIIPLHLADTPHRRACFRHVAVLSYVKPLFQDLEVLALILGQHGCAV